MDLLLQRVPFLEHLGIQVEAVGSGKSTLVLDLKPEHHNSQAMAHGGVLMTMLDVCMAKAARSSAKQHDDDDVRVVTIEMKTTFMQASTGQRVIARGVCVHRTTGMSFCEGELQDEHGRVLARASATFKYVRPKAAAHRSTK
jgi:uncharacterized protein (TIGR00369 family)